MEEIERTRFAALKQQARQHNEAESLRAYVNKVKSMIDLAAEDDRQKVQAWIEWAERSIDSLDPLSKGLPILMSENEAYTNSWRYRDQ
ncbi:hypothetical protein [Sinorhizobium meliloti]|uniref:hypothetical protein n=1 Tax=Rhizobium meliloti TaxID=382 RepID=UPI003F15EAC8